MLLLLSLVCFNASAAPYLPAATKDLTEILNNPVFERYGAFTIGHIRQGELGQSQAYFVRLVKPFSVTEKGVCIEFVNSGSWVVKGHPFACDED